jgi:hypothetical protein
MNVKEVDGQEHDILVRLEESWRATGVHWIIVGQLLTLDTDDLDKYTLQKKNLPVTGVPFPLQREGTQLVNAVRITVHTGLQNSSNTAINTY